MEGVQDPQDRFWYLRMGRFLEELHLCKKWQKHTKVLGCLLELEGIASCLDGPYYIEIMTLFLYTK